VNVPDINVLIALFRDDHPGREPALEWWNSTSSSGVPFTVPDQCWIGFVRIVTNRRIFPVSATTEQAFAFVDQMTTQPHHLTFAPHPHTLKEFERVAVSGGAVADLVPDAYLAALSIALGGTLVTFDRDFRRFDGLKLMELA